MLQKRGRVHNLHRLEVTAAPFEEAVGTVLQINRLHNSRNWVIIPSLTLVNVKSGYKPSSYADCSCFLFGNDLCYFFISSVLVLFIMLRMADFVINS